jgi:hypothetical protein
MTYRAPAWASPALLAALRSANIQQARFHKDGNWYHQLREFPGALCDLNGFVLFRTRADFLNTDRLVIRQDVHIRGDLTIAALPGYTQISASQN